MEWSFVENYIVCKFYLSHRDSWKHNIDEVMDELNSHDFGFREKGSVKMCLQNVESLCTGKGLSHASKQVKAIYSALTHRNEQSLFYTDLQVYIKENYVSSELNNSLTFSTSNLTGFLYTPQKLGPSFQEVLFEFIDRLELKDSEVYNSCYVRKDTFSHIRKGERGVSKKTVKQLCFGLKLSYDDAVVLMESAGYAFSNNDLSDVIVAYYLKNKYYDIHDANIALYENKAELLFC